MGIDIKIELKHKKIDVSSFSEVQIRKAAMRGINNALSQVKTLAIREVTKSYKLTNADVRPDVFVLKSSTANLTGKLLTSRRTIPIIKFKPTEVKDGVKTKFVGSNKSGSFVSQKTRDKTVGVRVEITRGQAATIRDSFIFFGSSAQPSLKAFGRYSGGSFDWGSSQDKKTTKLNTLSIAGALRNEQIIRSLRDKTAQIYEKTYLSQLQTLLK